MSPTTSPTMIPRPTWDNIVLEAKANSFLELSVSDCSSIIIPSNLSFLVETSVLTGSKLVR